ncbi:MAG: RNA methyltransferase [Oscillospiraceae bacterium]|nr:RNA methyltransferase [Oscillospiraceae bacterium]
MKITSRKNQLVVQSRGLLREKRLRDEEGLFAVEGVKLCLEALSAGITPKWALVSETAAEKFVEAVREIEQSCAVTVVSDDLYDYLSEQKTPQGIFLAGQILDKSVNLDRILSSGKILLLDCVQDSGNLGAMLRTAEALGIGGVILGDGCADVWSPKTLRASMGSAFRLPACAVDMAGAVKTVKEKGFAVYAAMLDDTAQRLGSFAFPEKSAVVIGNEGHGVSAEVAGLCQKVYIPIQGAESLNAAAAAAILCWEMSK